MSNTSFVLIVEDELITATSIAELLEQEEYAIAGIAKDADSAIRLCQQKNPAVIICDINIRGNLNGIDLAKQIRELYSSQIIFLTAYTDAATVENAVEADPVMYLIKPFNDRQLLIAVQMAFRRFYRARAPIRTPALQLTSRELEIVHLVAQGLSSKQIAQQLFISDETVKTHRRRMLQKNNINSFPQLIYMLTNQV